MAEGHGESGILKRASIYFSQSLVQSYLLSYSLSEGNSNGKLPGSRKMRLDYDLIEDAFDETTNIRSMTEQARIPGRGWMVRTTLYTPHHVSVDVTFIPVAKKKKPLFDPLT